ncbi:MAG TPA: NAD(P)H-dependent glycerol-3-phosphate dehydrogenase [Chitinispirillaceae bacterium]|nr:NAD(P)H-dependent glycerol-3-phosphate dehydrogenase [Chitinispirillaceae bacterium]
MRIGILGAGSWAIALSVLLYKRGHQVCMWEFNSKDAEMLRQNREHPMKLPGIRIPDAVEIVNDITVTIKNSDIIICAVPSQTMRSTMRLVAKSCSVDEISNIQGWVIVAKGIETNTLKLMTDILLEELPQMTVQKLLVLSGPSHAEEVSRDIPTTIVAASENLDLAIKIQENFSTESFRIYTNTDVRGVELAGSIKNVIALAAGIGDGLGCGDNTKGALMTRGIAEMMRLGRKMGAQESTFSGLAGIGDLITTCISKHSRNRRMGELIASGLTLQEALAKMTMVAEGVETTRSVYQLAHKLGIEMPITEAVYSLLFEGKDAKLLARALMGRELKTEWY